MLYIIVIIIYHNSMELQQIISKTVTETKNVAETKIGSGITKVVKIQDLKPVKQYPQSYSVNAKESWKRTKCNHWDKKCKCTVLSYEENCVANTYGHSNSFYSAFANAYNNHEDVVLSPDDTWMIICLHFSKYINDNAEKMRHMFVSHEGKKKLTVCTSNDLSESQWGEFFNLMIEQIKANTKGDIVNELKSRFTTTGRVEEILSVAAIMDSFKQYFTYGRCIPCCGIKNVRFMGTLEDWQSVLERTIKLKKYAVSPIWTEYIDKLVPILNKFIDTYNGKVDVDFWNKIMNITHGRMGSGSTTFVSGWILNFFGIYNRVDTDDIKSYSIDVPVEVQNFNDGGCIKNMNIVGGFGGVNKEDGAYRPQLSFIVYWDGVKH